MSTGAWDRLIYASIVWQADCFLKQNRCSTSLTFRKKIMVQRIADSCNLIALETVSSVYVLDDCPQISIFIWDYSTSMHVNVSISPKDSPLWSLNNMYLS